MNNIAIKPYKLSLWEDKNVYIIQWVYDDQGHPIEGAIEEVEILPEILPTDKRGYKILNQYFKEVKLVDIGSNTMDTPIRAYEPIFKTELNGAHTLIFKLFYRYFDDESGTYKDNPFITLMSNERKVKLFYDDVWYDFVIKKVSESTDQMTATYTCSDVFVNELSKNGFNIELKTDLENNQGTITELAKSILAETDWIVGKSDILRQTTKEPLYIYTLQSSISATAMEDFDEYDRHYIKGRTYTIPSGARIFIFYSSLENNENALQFLWLDNFEPSTDDDGYILNSPNFTADVATVFNTTKPFDWSTIDIYPLTVSIEYRGNKLTKKQISKFLPNIDKYCQLWSRYGHLYWSYTENDYSSPDEVKEMLQNGTNYTSIDGWSALNDGNGKYSAVILDSYVGSDNKAHSILKLDFHSDARVNNEGFYSHRGYTNGLVAGDSYIFAIKTLTGGNNLLTPQLVLERAGYETITVDFTDISTLSVIPDILQGYKVYRATITNKEALSYEDLIMRTPYFYVRGTIGTTISVIDAKLFKQVLKTVDLQKKFMVPNMETLFTSIIRKKYYFFPKENLANVHNINQLSYNDTFWEDEIPTDVYQPVYELEGEYEPYEKIRSIEGSESNCFNLIQTLCETFECWAQFTVGHQQKTGELTYHYIQTQDSKFIPGKQYYIYRPVTGDSQTDLDYRYADISEFTPGVTYYERQYDKYVSFHEFIGQDNDAGFRYGINLSNIQRSLDSNTLVSKLIVKPNNNEFAPGGLCTIQQADLNPTGETMLYNFDYYIKQGLLDAVDVHHDLYGPRTLGLDLYHRLKNVNKDIVSLTEEEVALNTTLDNLIANKTTFDVIVTEAKTNYENVCNKLESEVSDYSPSWEPSSDHNDVINSLITQRNYLYDVWQGYLNSQSNTQALYEQYHQRLDEVYEALRAVESESAQIMREFYKKYSRFIQEGSWIDENYLDPNLYYLDAQSVLYTSAYPKVSYTINVLELSQLDEYKSYHFKIGDKSYIEDTEYFGYTTNGKPYQEEIIVSEISYNLDDPSQNTLKIQNYKTQFEDLFQRIAATTQSLQYASGAYERAADIVEANGTLNIVTLQNSLKNNSLIISNARDQSVTWDETGLSVTSLTSPNQIVKLISGGIMMTTDGGRTWTTGITGSGINANSIAAGVIDTNRITIANSNWSAFAWDVNGINAYVPTDLSDPEHPKDYNYNHFVRLDRFGLYGHHDEGSNVSWVPTSEQDIIDNDKVNFRLTWSGFRFRTKNGAVDISTDDDLRVLDRSGNERVKIGQLATGRYGMQLHNSSNELTLFTDDSGNLNLANSLTIANIGDILPRVQLGYLTAYKEEDITNHQVFNANNAFIVYEDGSIVANNAEFSGQGSFSGSIYADNGYFSGPIAIAQKINGTYETSSVRLGYLENYEEQVGLTDFKPNTNYYLYNSETDTYDLVGELEPFDPNKRYYCYMPQVFNANNKFIVYKDGSLIAKDGTFTGIINAEEAHFLNGFSIGENFFVDKDGRLEASQGTFTGVINAQDGNFDGYINATGVIQVGDNGSYIVIDGRKTDDTGNRVPTGLYSGNWYVNETGEWVTDAATGFYISVDGYINAKGMNIAGGAKILDRLKIGDNCYVSNPNVYDHEFIAVYDKENITHRNILIEDTGVITVGPIENQICIDGGRGMIASANYEVGGILGWQIDNQQAIFNNIVAHGSIKSSVFEYGQVQAVGGILVVRPSSIIRHMLPTDNAQIFDITVENSSGLNPGDYCKIQLNDNWAGSIIGKLQINDNITSDDVARSNSWQLEIVNEWPPEITYVDCIGQPIIDYGTKGQVGIAINSSDIDAFVPGRAITVFESMIEETSTALIDGVNPKIIIGVIPNNYIYNKKGNNSAIPTYGLYAENAMIKGAVIAEDIGSPDRYVTGIDTNSQAIMPNPDKNYFPLSESGRIVLWAGAKGSAPEQIESAPFKVDTYGNVYAGSGYFEGTIISNASISAAEIRTATITGWDVSLEDSDKRAALTIRDCAKGIQYVRNGANFYDKKYGPEAVDETVVIMDLNEQALQLYNDLRVNETFNVNGNTGTVTAANIWMHRTYNTDDPLNNIGSIVLNNTSIQFSTTQGNIFGDSLNNMASINYQYNAKIEDGNLIVTPGGLMIEIENRNATYYQTNSITNYLRTVIDANFSLGEMINYVQVRAGENAVLIGYDIYVEG